MHERLKGIENVHTVTLSTFPWTLALGLVALVLGALTDYLATDGARINLLAPPLLGLLLWNLMIYVLLFAKVLHLLPSELPMRKTITHWFVTLSTRLPITNSIQRAYTEAWTRHALPQYKLHIARALHLAAMAFACGLLLGIVIRGIGTALLKHGRVTHSLSTNCTLLAPFILQPWLLRVVCCLALSFAALVRPIMSVGKARGLPINLSSFRPFSLGPMAYCRLAF